MDVVDLSVARAGSNFEIGACVQLSSTALSGWPQKTRPCPPFVPMSALAFHRPTGRPRCGALRRRSPGIATRLGEPCGLAPTRHMPCSTRSRILRIRSRRHPAGVAQYEAGGNSSHRATRCGRSRCACGSIARIDGVPVVPRRRSGVQRGENGRFHGSILAFEVEDIGDEQTLLEQILAALQIADPSPARSNHVFVRSKWMP